MIVNSPNLHFALVLRARFQFHINTTGCNPAGIPSQTNRKPASGLLTEIHRALFTRNARNSLSFHIRSISRSQNKPEPGFRGINPLPTTYSPHSAQQQSVDQPVDPRFPFPNACKVALSTWPQTWPAPAGQP